MKGSVPTFQLGTVSLLMVGFGPSCAADCPDGYRQEHDVCVLVPEVPAHRCSVLPPTKLDPRGDGVLARVDIVGGDCIWMDATEVTVEAYQGWIEDPLVESVAWEPTWCKWKTQRSDPVNDPNDLCAASIPAIHQPFALPKPIRCVDFCDAEAFCEYAGKRLCYGVATSVQGPRGVPREWLLACTNGFETVYPWGDDQAEGNCNVSSVENCVDCDAYGVGSEPLCRNSNGVADLLGNVAEWIFACNFIEPGQESNPSGCTIRGGGFDEPLQACSSDTTLRNDSRRSNLGFRCCSDLTPEEELSIVE
jgi:formylglycine-generating enzyme required for sulfatase activity